MQADPVLCICIALSLVGSHHNGNCCSTDEKPLSDVWMLTVAAPVPVAAPKEPKSHKKKDTIGMKMITSYNLFCEHRRPEVRQANPNIVPR